jgi:hypothetical protein
VVSPPLNDPPLPELLPDDPLAGCDPVAPSTTPPPLRIPPPPLEDPLLPIELPPPPPPTLPADDPPPTESLLAPSADPPPLAAPTSLDPPLPEEDDALPDDPPGALFAAEPEAGIVRLPSAVPLVPSTVASSPSKSLVATLPAMETRGPIRFVAAAAEIKTANKRSAYSGIDAPRWSRTNFLRSRCIPSH